MPDVPKHAWTHRPRSQGGTDPLDIEVTGSSGQPTAIATGGSGVTRSTGSAIAFNRIAWADEYDDIFGLAVTSGSPPTATAKYVTVPPGTYRLDTLIFWTASHEFAPGENPYIEARVWFPDAASEDTVTNSFLGPMFDNTQGGIWDHQLGAAEMEYEALMATHVFSWEQSEFPGEPVLGFGVALVESASLSTLAHGGHLVITQLNPFKHTERVNP